MNFRPVQVARFWALVGRVEPDRCWLWTGAKGTTGYGVWKHEAFGHLKSHRVAYTLTHGKIPEGLTIDHLCGNKLCCNPFHLEPVTQGENAGRYQRSRPPVCRRGHAVERGVQCLVCNRERAREWRAANPERSRAIWMRYAAKSK